MEHKFTVGQKWHCVLHKLQHPMQAHGFDSYNIFIIYIHSFISCEIPKKNQDNFLVTCKQTLQTLYAQLPIHSF
jgi:hypothetical protein